MNKREFARYGLAIRLFVVRLGLWRGGLIAATAAVVVAWLFAMPQLAADNRAMQERVDRLQKQIAARTLASAEKKPEPLDPVAQFRKVLGREDDVDGQLKALLNAATTGKLVVRQAQYKSSTDVAGGFAIYQIDMPVRGQYRNVRLFCEQALRALPFAALEEVRFKRDTVSTDSVEATLRWRLYVTPSNPASVRAPELAAAQEDD